MTKPWASLLVAAILIAIVGGGYVYWNTDLRLRPKTITKHQDEIVRILDSGGWVSPGLTGPKLYMVGFRSCPDCVRFETEEFPGLHMAGVDTRVIMIARADKNGVAKSTPAERSTVAELGFNRSWALLQAWNAVPVDAWTAPGIAPADGDAARMAVVESRRKLVEDLRPLLKDNGIDFAYPTLIWWTKDGQMRGCACEDRDTYRFVRSDLGAAAPHG
jgi:hypothetical protein